MRCKNIVPLGLAAAAVFGMITTFPTFTAAARNDTRLRLDLNLSLFRVGYQTELEDNGADDVRFTTGPFASNLGFGIGAVFRNAISVGCRILIGIGESPDGFLTQSDLYFAYGVLPFFEYAFRTGRVRPFLHLSAGVGGFVNNIDDDHDIRRTRVQFIGGFGAGIHIFFGPRISLDWWLLERLGVGKEKRTFGANNGVETPDSESAMFTSDTDIFIGLTAWI